MTTHYHYNLTADDHLARLRLHAHSSAVARRFLWVAYLAIVGLAWLSAVLFYVKQGDRSLGYLAYSAFAAALTASLPWLYRRYQDAFWASVLTESSLRGLVGPTVLTLTDDHVEEAGPVLTARAAWRDVLRVEREAGRTFVFLAPRVAAVVPDRAFADEAARATFDRELTARLSRREDVV